MHQTRKVIAIGRSLGVIIPPHIIDHLNAEKGDFLVFDDRYANFCLIVKGMIPPFDQISLDFPPLPDTAPAPAVAMPGTEGQAIGPAAGASVPLGPQAPESLAPSAIETPP
jgi:hypothetical protein